MIKLNNITKYYNDGKNVSLGVRKINLEFNKGEFIAVTGESGSGKSTLLNVLSGIDSYEEGELYFNNHPTSHFDNNDWEDYRNKKIGFIFQNYNLIDSYTVLENILSTLYIQGFKEDIALKKAKLIIEKVGLTDRISNKAVQLSSGQKQRLSIARALAKDTEVIMADEPTGNLDVENGKEIIKLLHNISKEKLVIIVTHNYDEVKDYVTRKIVMYDGEVQLDSVVNNVGIDNNINDFEDNSLDNIIDEECKLDNKNSNLYEVNKKWLTARKFAILNIKSQPKKVMLLLFFFIVTSLASFIFLGGVLSKLDDTSTKLVKRNTFVNNNLRRIVVRKKDNNVFNNEDIEEINKIEKVVYVDANDLANEVNYFYRKNVDYSIVFNSSDFVDEVKETTKDTCILLENYNNFVCNSNLFKQEDLSCGKLPNDLYEVLICSKDKSLLGKEIDFYFTSSIEFAKGEYAHIKMKVVGLVNSNSEKVYFSDKFEDMITKTVYNYKPYFIYCKNQSRSVDKYIALKVLINNNLQESEMLFSNKILETIDVKKIFNTRFYYYNYNNEKWMNINITINDNYNSSSSHIVEVNEKLFYSMYNSYKRQLSVFAKDYAYVDNIIEKLVSLGYEAVSPVKVNSIQYDEEKVRVRLRQLAINIFALIIMCVLEIIIIRALLKYKKKDFVILKLIGMKNKTVSKINYMELFLYKLCSIIITLVVIVLLNINKVNYITNITIYYNLSSFVIYLMINLVTLFLLALSYNRYLYKHFNITSLNID